MTGREVETLAEGAVTRQVTGRLTVETQGQGFTDITEPVRRCRRCWPHLSPTTSARGRTTRPGSASTRSIWISCEIGGGGISPATIACR